MNGDFWISFAIGFAIGWPVGHLVAPRALWLIDRVMWWRFETGRTTRYSGGYWSFTRRELDMQRIIWRRHRG